ncbi:MAG: Short-chain dehydrogenase/reductase [Phycisphaerales bacterium]|nr:Short-chain dehydrogenase/reductase [Phycisphaerales bacterium]
MATALDRETRKPLAVVTGASSGIGLELAKQLASHGYDLMLAANESSLDDAAQAVEAAGGTVAGRVQADLATFDGVERLAGQIDSLGRPVDVLALNAGVGLGGSFIDDRLEDQLHLVQLDVVSTVHLAKRVVPDMVTRGSGRVLITASIAAITPTPFETVYGPSKAFVKSFAESLHNELKDTGVTVTAFMPGPTETNFFHRAGMDDTKIGAGSKDDPSDVARQAIDAMLAGTNHAVVGTLKTKAQAVAMESVLPRNRRRRIFTGIGLRPAPHGSELPPGTMKTRACLNSMPWSNVATAALFRRQTP